MPERHPDDVIVEIRHRQRRRTAPEPLAPDQIARIDPAEQDADDIGERIPADRKRSDADQDGIDIREWQGRYRHRGVFQRRQLLF